MTAPAEPKIFHITHVANLQQIVTRGALWSDAKCRAADPSPKVVGMSNIKERRLRWGLNCHPGTRVGDYVPFYFCPRSVMLYILHRGNHPELTYRGGQGPIVHLVADLRSTVSWANSEQHPWAFSDRNAADAMAEFFTSLRDLARIDWRAVNQRDFRDPRIKEGKQAEFLVYEVLPWTLVEHVGVQSEATRKRVLEALRGSEHSPSVQVEPSWYF